MPPRRNLVLLSVLWFSASALTANATPITGYAQTNLVSSVSGLAEVTDSNLINPWGVSETAGSPLWVSDQGASVATFYTIPSATPLTATPNSVVTIPTTASGPQGPTGEVSNSSGGFLVSGPGTAAHFIFANLNGTISARATGSTATIEVTTPGAVYTGLAINQTQTMIYAADSANGVINVFNSAWAPVTTLPPLAFTPPTIAAGLVPFNVQDIGGEVYVTYAPPGRSAQVAATGGEGAVAIFTESGGLISAFTSPDLASPWGIALAPTGFGEFSNDLLVANFAYGGVSSAGGEINVYNPTTDDYVATLDSNANWQGLWALTFGNGGNGGNPDVLYFTTGLSAESGGLLAAVSVPEPAAPVEFGTALGLLVLIGMRRSRKKSAC